MEEKAVIVQNVSKIFKLAKPITNSQIDSNNSNQQKTLQALDDITFDVNKGEILGIIGLNGSGKTTLLRIISGVYKPSSGSVNVNGQLSSLMQLGIGFHGDLDAPENIVMNGMLLGISKSEITGKVKTILKYAELEKFSSMKLKHFSSGMRARLAFATAIQINPDILLLDEILSVGDKDFQQKSYESFLSFTKNNKTIIHATHNLNRLKEFSDRVLLLHQGRMITIGKPDQVIQRYMQLNQSNHTA